MTKTGRPGSPLAVSTGHAAHRQPTTDVEVQVDSRGLATAHGRRFLGDRGEERGARRDRHRNRRAAPIARGRRQRPARCAWTPAGRTASPTSTSPRTGSPELVAEPRRRRSPSWPRWLIPGPARGAAAALVAGDDGLGSSCAPSWTPNGPRPSTRASSRPFPRSGPRSRLAPGRLARLRRHRRTRRRAIAALSGRAAKRAGEPWVASPRSASVERLKGLADRRSPTRQRWRSSLRVGRPGWSRNATLPLRAPGHGSQTPILTFVALAVDDRAGTRRSPTCRAVAKALGRLGHAASKQRRSATRVAYSLRVSPRSS